MLCLGRESLPSPKSVFDIQECAAEHPGRPVSKAWYGPIKVSRKSDPV
jgi:hypothetical protein